MRELARDVYTYLEQRNADPKPYVWEAKGAETLAKIRHAMIALEQAHGLREVISESGNQNGIARFDVTNQ